jgi:hypothetical protein
MPKKRGSARKKVEGFSIEGPIKFDILDGFPDLHEEIGHGVFADGTEFIVKMSMAKDVIWLATDYENKNPAIRGQQLWFTLPLGPVVQKLAVTIAKLKSRGAF